jgi:hypothetical protein
MNTLDTPPKFEIGTVSPNVSVEHATIRVMSDNDEPVQELRLQGRLKNTCPHSLDEVKCDLSYFDHTGRFLGLDLSSFTQLDEMDSGETAPFDILLQVPIEATRCVLNVHSRRVLHDIATALNEYVSSQKADAS